MILKLVSDWTGMVRNWWVGDRIRISPFIGRLASLQLGDRIQILDRIFCVGRRDSRSDTDVHVVYQLFDGDQCCQLNVATDKETRRLCGVLVCGRQKTMIFDGDVVFLCPVSG